MIRKILVALDSSERAPAVLAAAAEMAKRFEAVLVPVRAVLLPQEFPPLAASNVGPDQLPDHLVQVALDELRATADKAGVALALDSRCVRFGQPWREILHASEDHDVDLIVLGSHGYHGIDRILGTTAAKVANHARRHVLVIHDRDAPSSPVDVPQ